MITIYQIGQASKITKISTRMLRYYDAENILKPSLIHTNGYRLYSDSDIQTIMQIKHLRRYHFSYQEIKDLLILYPDPPKEVYLTKLKELKNTVDDYDLLIQELTATHQSPVMRTNDYAISLTETKTFNAFCKKVKLSEKELDTFLDQSIFELQSAHCSLLGMYFIIFHTYPTSIRSNFEVEFCQPTHSELPTKSFELKTFKGSCYISTLHYGSYDTLYDAYSALYTWINIHNATVKGPFQEKYFVDASLTSDSYAFITEISVPISK